MARGLNEHYVVAPATDRELLEAWYRLSFGQQQAQGIQAVPETVPAAPPGIEVREATEDDLDDLVELELVLPEHQQRSPVFGGGEIPNREEVRADWADGVRSPDEGVLLAFHDGRAVGSLAIAPVERSGMHVSVSRPDGACILGFAATLPSVRGLGAGLALTNACYAWACEHGYGTIVVDYRTANLESSRFWPRRGFRPTFYRLYRAIP
jgi:GNAT superfamily N-acetyltransferase